MAHESAVRGGELLEVPDFGDPPTMLTAGHALAHHEYNPGHRVAGSWVSVLSPSLLSTSLSRHPP